MDFTLEKIDQLSGNKATIYSMMPLGEDETLLDKFINTHSGNYKSEVTDIVRTIKIIADKKGESIH